VTTPPFQTAEEKTKFPVGLYRFETWSLDQNYMSLKIKSPGKHLKLVRMNGK
jgi:hypothetical protein